MEELRTEEERHIKEELSESELEIFDLLQKDKLTKDDEKRVETVGKGLELLIQDRRFTALYKQLTQALSQYLKEAAQYDEAIRRQYAPKLRQKEEELSRRMGREVRIDPFQDPEFVGFYNQNMNALKDNYQAAVDQVKEEARRMFEENK
jgi:hypothetical protein